MARVPPDAIVGPSSPPGGKQAAVRITQKVVTRPVDGNHPNEARGFRLMNICGEPAHSERTNRFQVAPPLGLLGFRECPSDVGEGCTRRSRHLQCFWFILWRHAELDQDMPNDHSPKQGRNCVPDVFPRSNQVVIQQLPVRKGLKPSQFSHPEVAAFPVKRAVIGDPLRRNSGRRLVRMNLQKK